ncbi:feruloyl-CoA synthase [Actinomadura darangshiensis]|uniref:Feruloyl-CoA synthase n=1 Tax=Actinomadura darangshiensis TaxID=705336 RepID=A0A4R5BCQ0_9ACTN|nr:feruloyl-CoA synthase [Actinomadura darangshiensis]TDD81544.1 feruloyl-CoA synthase [Actinomadura darangshiensis]
MDLFASPRTLAERRADGSIVLASALPLGPYAASMAGLFRGAAGAHPDRVLVADRDGEDWRRVTYGEARRLVDGLAQALLDHGASGRPVMILSGNSVEHLLLTLACYTIGSPAVPVSTAYSLLDPDHVKLRDMAALTRPAVVFADDADAYASALDVAGGTSLAGRDAFQEWARTAPAEVDEHYARVGEDTIAKILFTSGSTGRPKGVLNTHRMLCANQRMLRRIWPFLAEEPPVLLDWLPWSHTFGGNHNAGLAIANGGSLYVDDGRPGPDLVRRTVRNLADVRPTVYFNVPAGYASLLPHLEADAEFAAAFFSRMRYVFFAAAALPQQVWDGIAKVAASAGSPAPMTTSWGATETAPGATSAYFASGRSDCIGVPLPGVSIKLAPVGPKLEIRVKGPSVTPGYLDDPERTWEAFDEEGYYRTGDAVRMVDDADPDKGLVFDGRISEDFKLASGTWVSVGTLRSALLGACGGLVTDAVLTGHDSAAIGAMVWLNPARAAACADVRAALGEALRRLNGGATGASRRIVRLLVLDDPASLAHGEITDKGYVNQRAVLDHRAHLVELLQAEPVSPEVVLPA